MKFCRGTVIHKQLTILGYSCYPRYLSSSSSSASSKSSKQQNYYDVLGIDQNSSRKEIRQAFIDKSKEYHPDSVSRSELSSEQLKSKFQEINEAYQTLNDPTERRVYDESIKYPKAGYSSSNWRRHGYGNYSDYQQYRAHQEFMRQQNHYWANYNRQFNHEYEELTWKSFYRWRIGQPFTVANLLFIIFVFGVFVEIGHTLYIMRYVNQVKREREIYGSEWFLPTSSHKSEFDDTRPDEVIDRLDKTTRNKNETKKTGY